MTASEKLTAQALREEIAKLNHLISQSEIMAVIPPANCSDPVLFSRLEEEFAKAYHRRLSEAQEELRILEGQLCLAI